MSQLELNAKIRQGSGKSASRRLRRQDEVPAIIYGAGEEPILATLAGSEIRKALKIESFYSQPLQLKLADTVHHVIVKSLQRHPAKEHILHVDLQRIDQNAKITTSIPLHFLNEDVAPGVKAGGAVAKFATTISVRALPRDLPEFIAIDMAEMQIGDTLHLSDLSLSEGLVATELMRGHDQGIVGVLATRSSRSDEEEEAQAEDTEESTS